MTKENKSISNVKTNNYSIDDMYLTFLEGIKFEKQRIGVLNRKLYFKDFLFKISNKIKSLNNEHENEYMNNILKMQKDGVINVEPSNYELKIKRNDLYRLYCKYTGLNVKLHIFYANIRLLFEDKKLDGGFDYFIGIQEVIK